MCVCVCVEGGGFKVQLWAFFSMIDKYTVNTVSAHYVRCRW